MKKTAGFTLIELLVTVAILAVITAIAIPAYNGYMQTARMAEADANIAALKLAEEEYYLENGNYFVGANNTQLNTSSGSLWTAEGLEGGTPSFDYAVVLSGGGYAVTATGRTGTPVAGETRTYTKN